MIEVNDPLNVLVTGAGSVYGLGIIRALKASVLPIETIAIDTNPYSLGLFFADKGFSAPRAAD
jgi:carbamoyl-phosphate synthase large subunit